MLDGACRRVSACLADSTRQAAGPFPLSTLRRWVNEQKMPPTVAVTQCLRPSMAAAIPETDAHTQVWRPSDAAHSMRLGEVLGRVGWAPPPPPAPPMYVGPVPPPQRPGGPPPAIPQNPYAVNPSPQMCRRPSPGNRLRLLLDRLRCTSCPSPRLSRRRSLLHQRRWHITSRNGPVCTRLRRSTRNTWPEAPAPSCCLCRCVRRVLRESPRSCEACAGAA